METPFVPDPNLKNGTLGGILFVLLLQVHWEQLLETALIAAVGALVSFTVSLGLKWLFKKRKDR